MLISDKIRDHLTTCRIAGVLVFFLLTFLPERLSAQDDVVNNQIWLDFYPHYFHTTRFELYGNSGFRTQMGETGYLRFQIQPAVRYQFFSLLEGHGGLALRYFIERDTINRYEITPWQAVNVRWPSWQKLTFGHFIRIEERFSNVIHSHDPQFDLRFRYKLSVEYKIFREARIRYWYLTGYFEFFLPLQNDIKELYSNKFHAGMGAGYNFSTLWRATFITNFLRSRPSPEEKFAASAIAYQIKLYRFFWAKPSGLK